MDVVEGDVLEDRAADGVQDDAGVAFAGTIAAGERIVGKRRRIRGHRAVDVAERDVADDAGRGGGRGRSLRTLRGLRRLLLLAALRRADADADRAGHILEQQVRERHVLEARSRAAVELERTAEHLVQHAVRDGDVLGSAAAEAEDGPARAEVAVGHRDVLAAAEQRARIVLTLDRAVADGDVLAADEMKPVVVAADAVEDVEPFHLDVACTDDAHAVVGAPPEAHVLHAEMITAIEQQMIRAAVAADAARRRHTGSRRVKLDALAVDETRAFDRDVRRANGEEERPVAVDERRIAAKRIASTACCVPSALPSSVPDAAMCRVTWLFSSTVPM